MEHCSHIAWIDIFKTYLSARNRRCGKICCGNNTVGHYRILRTVKLAYSLYFYYTAAHTADFCTHTIQEVTQINNLRFTRRICNSGKALRTNCGKHSIFCCSDAPENQDVCFRRQSYQHCILYSRVLPEYRHRVHAKAFKCKSIGLKPIGQPPGILTTAFLHLEIIAPKNIIEERISRIKSSHILQSHIPLVSTVTVLPALCTLQPNLSSTKSVLSTSRRYGQFFKVHTPSAITVAASIGSTAFFAPLYTDFTAYLISAVYNKFAHFKHLAL